MDTRLTVLLTLILSTLFGLIPWAGPILAAPGRGAQVLRLPRDLGVHPDVPTESWRILGQLGDRTGRRFGFSYTLVRQGLSQAQRRGSAWAAKDLYFGLFTLADPHAERFHAFERLSRSALGLSGARIEPLRVWLEDWTMDLSGGDTPRIRLRLAQDRIRLALSLTGVKPMVTLSGGDAEPLLPTVLLAPRLAVRGTLRIGAERFKLRGLALLERVLGRWPMAAGQMVWDRCYIHLDDGRDIVGSRMRRRDGSGVPIDRFVVITPEGALRRLPRSEVEVLTVQPWESPRDRLGYRLPALFRFKTEGLSLG
ncbi:MAG: lipocalin-like domain-containing protein, partial [Gammaproteobacteria bacterium]